MISNPFCYCQPTWCPPSLQTGDEAVVDGVFKRDKNWSTYCISPSSTAATSPIIKMALENVLKSISKFQERGGSYLYWWHVHLSLQWRNRSAFQICMHGQEQEILCSSNAWNFQSNLQLRNTAKLCSQKIGWTIERTNYSIRFWPF